METRFKMLTKSKPEDAKQLWQDAQHDVEARFRMYEYLAQRKMTPDPDSGGLNRAIQRSRTKNAEDNRARTIASQGEAMVDLTTYYMGLKLRTPLVVSASPLSQEIGSIRRLEDAGASAVVLYSLFEEQLRQEIAGTRSPSVRGTDSFAESLTFFPQASEFRTRPRRISGTYSQGAKQAVGIPIIASLNGATVGGWTEYAKAIEQAGADALECNIYSIPTDADVTGAEVEQSYIDIVRAVKSVDHIPVAVKISPFFSNLANMAKRLDRSRAPMALCCSTASTSPILILTSWKSAPTFCSALRRLYGCR